MAEMKRTNVRLPESLHFSLKSAALSRGTSIEEIIRTAIIRELGEGTRIGPFDLDASYEDLLAIRQHLEDCSRLVGKCLSPQSTSSKAFLDSIAARFLACLPAAVIITGADGSIAWQNSASVAMFGSHVEEQDLGGVDAYTQGPDWREEDLAITGSDKKAAFRVVHFPFSSSDLDELLAYGRVLIPLVQYEEAARGSLFLMPVCDPEGLARSIADIPSQLASSFLECFPTTATVKDLQRNLRWYNETFRRISNAKSSDAAVGLKTEDVINLPDRAIQEHEELVLSQKRGVLAREDVDTQIRRNLRFPILNDHGEIVYLGAINTQGPPRSRDAELEVTDVP